MQAVQAGMPSRSVTKTAVSTSKATVFAALTAVIRDLRGWWTGGARLVRGWLVCRWCAGYLRVVHHPMNISGFVPHRATVGRAEDTVARAAGDDRTRPWAGAKARRSIAIVTTKALGSARRHGR